VVKELNQQVPTKSIGEMKKTLKRLIKKYCIDDGREPPSAFLWGGPGIGKSSIVKQSVKELGMDLENCFKDQRLQQIDPVDLRGLPFPNDDGRLQYHPPSFLPDESGKGIRGVLFLDELNLAPQQVQSAAYELILDRKLGDNYHLPDDWMVIAAGNRAGDKAFVNPMSAPLANRFIHWEVVPDFKEWKEWGLQKNSSNSHQRIRSEIIGFLNFKSEMLYQFDPERSGEAFPTPRSWENVSKLMEDGLDGEKELAAAVGMGAATEFMSFLEMQNELPKVNKILEGDFKIPKEPDKLHAIISSLVDRVKDKPGLAGRLVEYANHIPDDRTEFSIVLVKDAMRADIPVQETNQFKEFAREKEELIL